jgi:hypothetical protein
MNTNETRIEIDDRIREKPELAKAASEASTYLLGEIKRVPPPAVIHWQFAPFDESTIELWMSDTPDGKGFVAKRVFPLQHMTDPVTRDIWALRVCGALFAQRSRVIQARIDQKFRDMERDDDSSEANGTP